MMLDLDWYIKSPLDFEYKNYILLSYLSELDTSFADHNLSPYLLYTEKLIEELKTFVEVTNHFKGTLKREWYSLF